MCDPFLHPDLRFSRAKRDCQLDVLDCAATAKMLMAKAPQRRDDHWAIVDLVGKGRHIRTVPVTEWVKTAIDSWLDSAEITDGRLFRCVCRAGKTWGDGMTESGLARGQRLREARIEKLAPHDLRRSCARLLPP
jgi:site-specific recombinase XerC